MQFCRCLHGGDSAAVKKEIEEEIEAPKSGGRGQKGPKRACQKSGLRNKPARHVEEAEEEHFGRFA